MGPTAPRMEGLMANARYKVILVKAWLAHKLTDMAERIMPAGHSRGRFERPAEEMRESLANYGVLASRYEARSTRQEIKLRRVKAVQEDMRKAGAYDWADALRAAMSDDDKFKLDGGKNG
jgi:hypothetical protein